MKCLAVVKIDGIKYSIRASKHALIRMSQRNIDSYQVTGNILSLGKEGILSLQQQEEEAIIIDKVKDLSIVIGFNRNTITVITVIDKSNIYIKEGTKVEQLQDYRK